MREGRLGENGRTLEVTSGGSDLEPAMWRVQLVQATQASADTLGPFSDPPVNREYITCDVEIYGCSPPRSGKSMGGRIGRPDDLRELSKTAEIVDGIRCEPFHWLKVGSVGNE